MFSILSITVLIAFILYRLYIMNFSFKVNPFFFNFFLWLSIGSDDVCILQLIYEHGGGSAAPAQRQS